MNPFGNKKILFIEDEVMVAQLWTIYLEKAGYVNIRHAETGLEGLEIAREWRPELIVSDLKHPGPDGFDVFNELFLDPHTLFTRFIMISGCSLSHNPDFDEKLCTAGVSVYLQKPVTKENLLACVDKVFADAEQETLKGL